MKFIYVKCLKVKTTCSLLISRGLYGFIEVNYKMSKLKEMQEDTTHLIEELFEGLTDKTEHFFESVAEGFEKFFLN